jgi:acetolactate decarboxylase
LTVPKLSIGNAALGEYLQTTRHRLYQISTAAALVQGVYEGAVSSRTLLDHGDFGLGTIEHLDGEMVVLDGSIYSATDEGSKLIQAAASEPEFHFNGIDGTLVCFRWTTSRM